MFGVNWVDLFGYFASFVVLVSLLMNSLIRFRLINFVGGVLFVVYGFEIGAMPIVLINAISALINAYYLVRNYYLKGQ